MFRTELYTLDVPSCKSTPACKGIPSNPYADRNVRSWLTIAIHAVTPEFQFRVQYLKPSGSKLVTDALPQNAGA